MKTILLFCMFILATLAVSKPSARGHFAWLAAADDGQAQLYFGESPAERAYHLPEALADAEVWRRGIDVADAKLSLQSVDEEDFIGLQSEEGYERRGVLTMKAPYGLYHGTLLTYYATALPSRIPAEWPQAPSEELELQIVPRLGEEKLTATLYWKGEPLKHTKVMLYGPDGEMTANESTDDQGVVEFTTKLVEPGINGLMAGYTDEEASGEWEGEAYESAAHYATTTFEFAPKRALRTSALPTLPEAVSSFGAAAAGDYLYVYSGHRGTAHAHSRDNLSGVFVRTKLDGSGAWEQLPMQTPLQGLPLVAHEGKLYRVGGLSADNAAGEDAVLNSVDEFACYDPESETWTQLPSLPAPRSSHDAAAAGDTLYVAGGWQLTGDSDGQWQHGAIAFDLNNPEAGWRELSKPPFQRRALAVAAAGDQLAVLCGMDADASISSDVYFYDPKTEQWSEGPTFPGKEFHGFGVSACSVGGELYASGMEGVIYRLADDRSSWEPVADIAVPRFFHRLVPADNDALLVVGGATAEEGHVRSIERVVPEPGGVSSEPVAAN